MEGTGPLIAAGIVTFQPDVDRLRANLAGVIDQVDSVIIFDNGSSNLSEIDELVRSMPPAKLLSSDRNLGIAAALNRLGDAAAELGAKWILTLDQDSVSPPEMVASLRSVMKDGVGIVTPYIVDRNKLTEAEFRALDLPAVEVYPQPARRGAITSGSLVDIEAWKAVGGYDERFFIDYVDYDFNQRISRAGYRILRANRTYLLHEVGKAERTWLWVPRRDLSHAWRLERFYSFGHSPERCYYKARNRVLFTRKHGRNLGITHEGIWQVPRQVALTLLFERNRWSKLRAFARGLVDGFTTPLETDPRSTGRT